MPSGGMANKIIPRGRLAQKGRADVGSDEQSYQHASADVLENVLGRRDSSIKLAGT